jgi:hypothetical protein
VLGAITRIAPYAARHAADRFIAHICKGSTHFSKFYIDYKPQKRSSAAGNGLGTTIKYLRGAAGIGLCTTIKYLRGAAGVGLGTTTKLMRRSTSGTAGNGLCTTAKYLRGAAGIGLGATIKHLRRTGNGMGITIKDLVNENTGAGNN